MRFLRPSCEGTPYPGVYGVNLPNVPEQTITRAPTEVYLVHLCRFVVFGYFALLSGFS